MSERDEQRAEAGASACSLKRQSEQDTTEAYAAVSAPLPALAPQDLFLLAPSLGQGCAVYARARPDTVARLLAAHGARRGTRRPPAAGRPRAHGVCVFWLFFLPIINNCYR